MPNTSATGGYLLQTAGPTENLDFRRFIGEFIAGVTGLTATLVRPMWQPNPAPIPSIDINWVAYGIRAIRADANPYIQEKQSGLGAEQTRHEESDVLVSFYGPDCLGNAASFRDSVFIRQNQEMLYTEGVAVVGTSDITHVPELINERWFDRCDLIMTMRREIKRDYLILKFLAADGSIIANRGTGILAKNWTTEQGA